MNDSINMLCICNDCLNYNDRPTVAGIHGDSELGAYSVALSGGYEDNVDLGECFTYTGEGQFQQNTMIFSPITSEC